MFLLNSPFCLAHEASNSIDLTEIPIDQLVTMDVSSASKIASQVSMAPSAVSIVTADDIKNYGYRTIAEILESMRGLYVTKDRAYSFSGGRGFGRPGDFAGRIMLLLDGTQVNNNIYNSAGIGYTAIIDPALIERVEYVSGPGSAIYGNNAFFGIINIVTKHGHDINGLQLTGEVASFNSKDAKINYGKRLDNGADILLSASGFNSDGQNLFFPDTVQAIPGSDGVARGLDGEKSRHVFGKIEWDNWFAEIAYTNRNKDVPTAPFGADFNKPYSYEDSTLEANVKYHHQLNDALKVSLHSYYGQYHYRGRFTYSSFLFPGAPNWREHSDGAWWGINAQFVGTWFDNQRIVFGTEYRDDFKQDIHIPIDDFDTHEKTLSIYAQDEITLSSKIILNIGGRYDINKSFMNYMSHDLSPRLALIYKPLDSTSLKLSWSSAYRRSNPFEKYYTDGSLLPNPELKSEHIEASELVLEHDFGNSTRLLASAYQYNTHDYIKSTRASANTSRYTNTDGDEARGVEFEFEKHWLNDIKLKTSAIIQYTKDNEDNWVVNSPKRIAKANISTPLWHKDWRASFEMQAYSKRLTERDSIASGYSVANLTLTADELLPNLDLSFGIRNLFDRDYVAVAPRSNLYQTTIPQDCRSYWFRMSYDFKWYNALIIYF